MLLPEDRVTEATLEGEHLRAFSLGEVRKLKIQATRLGLWKKRA